MCGIAGFLKANGTSAADDRARLAAMASIIAHRGPDDEDVFAADGVGFAHRRLAVIDPSPHGRQPMTRGRLTVVYNGEIYNHRELRAELEAAGERFVTSSDTEVLLAALDRWGLKALERFNGMFAFAVWDARERTLTLARDRIGKKPLYYARVGRDLIFGSEIKAILTWPELERAPDYEAIHHFLSLQYVPCPFTAFKGVRRLPPGSWLTVTPGGRETVGSYWSLRPPTEARESDERELEERIREGLRTAVRRRMVADVPVGAFLSGGVDSSVVTAMMAEESGAPIKTFSIGFEDETFDERRFARIVAERFGTDHHEEVVRPDAASLLPEIVWHYGEPFADPSAIPTYFVSRLARRHVTVSLSGDGGDEFFLGYTRYADCAKLGWVDRLPESMRGAAGLAASLVPPALAGVRPFGGVRRRLQLLSTSRAQRYEPAMMYFFDIDKPAAYGEALRPFLPRSTLGLLDRYFAEAPTLVSGAAWADIHTYLPDDILVKVDVASMAWGLEARAPFLDVELMELASAIPDRQKLRGGVLKGLLKDSLRPILPDEILDRPKMGFGVPIESWFRDDLREFTRDLLSTPAARGRGLFRDGYAIGLLDAHVAGRRLNHTRLWAMVMLELWFQTWIDAPSVPKSVARAA